MPRPVVEKWGTTGADFETYVYKWTVNDYSFLSEKFKDTYITSPPITFNEETWYIHLFPNAGQDEDETIDIEVLREAVTKAVEDYNPPIGNEPIYFGRIEVLYPNLDPNAKKTIAHSRSFKITQREQLFTAKLTDFMKATEIKRVVVDNTSNDTLHVNFKLIRLDEAEYTNGVVKISQAAEANTDDDKKWGKLSEMYLDDKFSDVKLVTVADGKELAAHKIVLASRVPYFEKMFASNMKESSSNVVEVADVEFNVLKELLRFVYTGEVENVGSVAQDLLVAADKYMIEDLKNHCERYLCDAVGVECVLGFIELADKCNASELKNRSIKFARANLAEIIESNEFREMSQRKCCRSAVLADILRAFTQ